MIEKRKLGKYGPELTTVGFGAWAVGGPWVFGWGPQDDQESINAIRKALELGLNWIDTAAAYGFGHSEEVVCKALDGISREDVFIATKCGLLPNGDQPPKRNLAPENIRKEVEASLKRLGTEFIDLYQFHWPDSDSGAPVEESWTVMANLQKEGKVRFIGVSNFDVSLLERCEAVHHVDSCQPPYSLLNRSYEAEVLPWCLEHGVGVVAYSPMQSGLLTGAFDINRLAPDDWRRRGAHYKGEKLEKNLQFVEKIRPIAQKHDKTVGQLAVAWVLMNPAVTSAIVGARRPSQVEQNMGGMGWKLTAEEMSMIEDALEVTR
jgi:aryl-alcohol dehydrogenase-like predicted oxidoreductase